jgi:hypothetical protein
VSLSRKSAFPSCDLVDNTVRSAFVIDEPRGAAQFRAASDSHFFSIDDVVDYPIPAKNPPVEIGKLVDDMSVTAVLLTDTGAPMVMEHESEDNAVTSATCLAGAKDPPAHVHGGTREQTIMVVPIRTAAIKSAT